MEVVFDKPEYLWFLGSIALLIVIHFYTLKHQKKRAMRFANFEAIARVTGEEVFSKNIFILFIRMAALFFVTLALAGTTIWYLGETSDSNFVLAIDSSTSMSATDLDPSRLESAKKNAIKFVEMITTGTKVGIISFSGTSFINQGLSENYEDIKNKIKNIKISGYGGTDLGEAIISSTNLLLRDTRPKVLILLTDGRSNIGVPLEDSVNYANENKIMIHTIGIGTKEGGKFVGDSLSKLDEEGLKNIALNTDGTYYYASDDKGLEEIYTSIVKLNKQKIPINASPIFMILSLLILFMEWALINTKYRIFP